MLATQYVSYQAVVDIESPSTDVYQHQERRPEAMNPQDRAGAWLVMIVRTTTVLLALLVVASQIVWPLAAAAPGSHDAGLFLF
jgi:hypothetical protein